MAVVHMSVALCGRACLCVSVCVCVHVPDVSSVGGLALGVDHVAVLITPKLELHHHHKKRRHERKCQERYTKSYDLYDTYLVPGSRVTLEEL